jgi:hypothetical protein
MVTALVRKSEMCTECSGSSKVRTLPFPGAWMMRFRRGVDILIV